MNINKQKLVILMQKNENFKKILKHKFHTCHEVTFRVLGDFEVTIWMESIFILPTINFRKFYQVFKL